MTLSQQAPAPATTHGVVRLLRVFLVRVLLIAVAYSVLIRGSKGGSVGPEPGAEVVSFTIGPNPVMFVIFAVIVFRAFRAAERGEPDLAAMLRRRLLLLVALTVVSWIVAACWIMFYPLEGWPQPNTWFYPFPFASVEMVRAG